MIGNNFKYTLNMKEDIILYESGDGNIKVSLFARDGSVWLNQSQLAELFATSKPNINIHITNILKDKELDANSVIKDYLTTDSDGKNYKVKFYSLEMMNLSFTRFMMSLTKDVNSSKQKRQTGRICQTSWIWRRS